MLSGSISRINFEFEPGNEDGNKDHQKNGPGVHGGDSRRWLDTINTIRATTSYLPRYTENYIYIRILLRSFFVRDTRRKVRGDFNIFPQFYVRFSSVYFSDYKTKQQKFLRHYPSIFSLSFASLYSHTFGSAVSSSLNLARHSRKGGGGVVINKNIFTQRERDTVFIFTYVPHRGMTVIKLRHQERRALCSEGSLRTKITDYRDRTLSKEPQERVLARVKDSPLPRCIGFSATYRLRFALGSVPWNRSDHPCAIVATQRRSTLTVRSIEIYFFFFFFF